MFMKSLARIILFLILTCPVTANSQQTFQPDSLLNKLIGKWELRGTIAGKEIIHDVEAKRVLNGQYIQLMEVSRDKDEQGKPNYDATVYFCWQESKKQYFCLWLDNTSNEGITNNVIGKARQNGDKIEFVFSYKNGERFHNTFLYDRNSNSWQWKLDSEKKGELHPFARVKLTNP